MLFGAITSPVTPDPCYRSPLLQLRKHFDLYANIRPCFPILPEYKVVDLNTVIVRENTEGMYTGREREEDGAVILERVVSEKGCRRIVEKAIKVSRVMGFNKITCVHKANVLRKSDGLFRKVFYEVMADTGMEADDMIVDAVAAALISKPKQFQCIVTLNLYGDILSDEAAALTGGLGMAPSANLSDHFGLVRTGARKCSGHRWERHCEPFSHNIIGLPDAGVPQEDGRRQPIAVRPGADADRRRQDQGPGRNARHNGVRGSRGRKARSKLKGADISILESVPISMSADLRRKITDRCREWGIEMVGFASADDWDDPPFVPFPPREFSPKAIFPGCRTVVVLGLPVTLPILETSPSIWYQELYKNLNAQLDERAYQLSEFLNRLGHASIYVPRDGYGSVEVLIDNPYAFFSHRHAAYLAGLGTFGLNNMLLHQGVRT